MTENENASTSQSMFAWGDEFESKRNSCRIPVVASYAHQLVSQLVPITALPLDLTTGALGAGGGISSARYQLNGARMRYPGLSFFARVRSWENAREPSGPKRKTLESLELRHQFRSNEEMGGWLIQRMEAWKFHKFPCRFHRPGSEFIRSRYPNRGTEAGFCLLELALDEKALDLIGKEIIVP